MTPAQIDSKKTGFREQAILTVKVLLIAGSTLGVLVLLNWLVVSK